VAGSPDADPQAGRGRRGRERRRGDMGAVAALTRARRPAGDVRRDDRPRSRDRPPAALLVSLERPGLDDGERRRVSGDRGATGLGRAAADRGPGFPAQRGTSGVRAPGPGRAAGEDRGASERVRGSAIVVIHTLKRVNSYDVPLTFPTFRSGSSTASPG